MSKSDVSLLQNAYLDYMKGEEENYTKLSQDFEEKYNFNKALWERLVEEGESDAFSRFTQRFLPYVTNKGFISSTSKLSFYPNQSKSSLPDMKIGKLSWDRDQQPDAKEITTSMSIVNKFLERNDLETISLEDFPSGIQSAPLFIAALKDMVNQGATYSTGDLERRVKSIIDSDIFEIVNRKVASYGDEVNITDAISSINSEIYRKRKTNSKKYNNFHENLKLCFMPSVLSKINPTFVNELKALFAKKVRDKPLSFWLVRVLKREFNLREFLNDVSIDSDVKIPRGFPRPEDELLNKPKKEELTYQQRRERNRNKKLVEGEIETVFGRGPEDTVTTKVIDGKRVVIDEETKEPKRNADGSYIVQKMDVEDLPPKQRKRVKTYMQDADPTEYFGEEYLKLGKVINILEGIVNPEDEEELAELDEDNLKLVKLAARLRKHYETLYAALGDMVYDREEEE